MHENTEKDFFSIMNRFRKLTLRVKLFEVSHGEFFMLGAIYAGKAHNKCDKDTIEGKHQMNCGVQISELNGILKGSKSATSKMLKNLEEKGYIQRISDLKDKRNIYVKLTDEGVRRLVAAKQGMQEMSGIVMERMGDEDMQHLIQLCNKLYNIMEDEVLKIESRNKRKGNI